MKILFQGDSITDADRDRSNPHDLGTGYPLYAAKFIKEENPDTEFEFIDLGISGNQTKDLVARLQSDFIDINPDIVSIHIGVNDTWHHAENRDWLDNSVFEAQYRTPNNTLLPHYIPVLNPETFFSFLLEIHLQFHTDRNR